MSDVKYSTHQQRIDDLHAEIERLSHDLKNASATTEQSVQLLQKHVEQIDELRTELARRGDEVSVARQLLWSVVRVIRKKGYSE